MDLGLVVQPSDERTNSNGELVVAEAIWLVKVKSVENC